MHRKVMIQQAEDHKFSSIIYKHMRRLALPQVAHPVPAGAVQSCFYYPITYFASDRQTPSHLEAPQPPDSDVHGFNPAGFLDKADAVDPLNQHQGQNCASNGDESIAHHFCMRVDFLI